ncbi:cohesin subunit SA-2-like [Sycon ciliatum]|uniref:cohesin subunit SA-2-like n=1 Tax=Sycon ciliatum TaxID=27933 RepID=UPI0031F653C4
MPVRGNRAAAGKADGTKSSPVPVRGSQRLRKKQEEEEEAQRLEQEQQEQQEQEEQADDSDDEGNVANESGENSDEVEDSSDEEEDEDDDDDNDDEDDEEEDNESGSDTERPVGRVVGPIRPRGRGGAAVARGGAQRQQPKSKAASASTKDLFATIKEGRCAFKLIVDEWIDEYKTEKGTAITKLIQFLVSSSGCKAEVTQEMVVSRNYDKTFKKLTQDFGETSTEYPFIASGPAWKKFKSNFVDFLDNLIQQSRHTLLYDGFFLEQLLPWLMTMSTSQVQAFRHTSTLAAMKLCTSFISVAQKIRRELENSERMLDVERKKASSRRIEVLEGQLDEKKDQISDLEEHMQKIFSGVFVMRYRDVVADIRSLCLNEIGEWIVAYNSMFLGDNYLKYIGWMLYDKAGEVRTTALIVLERLYKNESFHQHLDLFTHKFKDRVVEMVMDVDGQAGAHAIRVACALHDMDVLDDDNCEQIYQLVFVRPRAIAQAAGEFLVKFLFNTERLATRLKEEQEASQQTSPRKKRGKKSAAISETQFKLKELAKFFIECQAASSTDYFMDSLLPYMEELKDWQAYTSLLEEDTGLSSEEEECLISMMSCAIKRAVGGLGPPFRAYRKILSKKEKLSLEEQKNAVSSHFMSCLPALLVKYDADAAKVMELVSIPQAFDLSLYSSLRLKKQLSDFLSAVHRIVFKHSSEDVFEAVASTLLYLQQDDHPLQSTVDVAMESLLDAIAAETKKSQSQYTAKKTKSEEDTFALTVHLKRVSVFSRFVDMSKWELFNALQAILALGCEDPDAMSNDLIIACMHGLSTGMIMLVKTLSEQDSVKGMKSTVKTLRSHMHEFIVRCDELVSYSAPEVQMQAFILMANTIMVGHHLKFSKESQITALWSDLDLASQDRCREFIVANVLMYKDDDAAQQEKEDDDDDEDPDLDAEEERSQKLVTRREALSAYCKLVAFGMFDLKLAAPVLAYLIKCFPDYGDIIKLFLAKLREFNHVECAKVMLLALQQMFEEIRMDNDDGVVDRQSKDWSALKELAKRFGLSMGVDNSKTNVREMVGTIHRDGIVYSLSRVQGLSQKSTGADPSLPPNLDFFDIIFEFLFRLHATDRSNSPNSILSFLDAQLKDSSALPSNIIAQLNQSKWQTLQKYRNVLTSGGSAASKSSAATAATGANTVGNVLDEFDDVSEAGDVEQEPAAKRKATGRSRRPSTSQSGGMVAASRKKGADDVWLQRPSEAEVRQQKLEKARAAAARSRSGQGRGSTSSGRAAKTTAASSSSQRQQKASQKRRHEELSEEEEEEEEDADVVNQESEEEEMEESESLQQASQASWLSSQPKRAKPDARRSYGTADVRSPRADRSRLTTRPAAMHAQEEPAKEASPVKAPRRTRRVAKPMPDNIFDDALGGDNTDDSDGLAAPLF